jgi:hypothetical protein
MAKASTPDYRECIKAYTNKLRNLKTAKTALFLFGGKHLTEDEYKQINDKENRAFAGETTVKLLYDKGPDFFWHFVEALRVTGHDEFAKQLETWMGWNPKRPVDNCNDIINEENEEKYESETDDVETEEHLSPFNKSDSESEPESGQETRELSEIPEERCQR